MNMLLHYIPTFSTIELNELQLNWHLLPLQMLGGESGHEFKTHQMRVLPKKKTFYQFILQKPRNTKALLASCMRRTSVRIPLPPKIKHSAP